MSLKFDLIADYFPASVDDAAIQAAYSKIQTWYTSTFPELDTRPGSVFGDSYILPAATYMAANEKGLENLASDLDLDNVANGVIYNCDFVSMFLKNFGAYDNKDTPSTGVVRLVFSTNIGRTLNKSTQLSPAGSGNDETYQFRIFGDSELRVLPVGSSKTYPNDYVLTQSVETRYFVDIPVEGFSAVDVKNGNTMQSNVQVTGLESITAVGDFFISSYTSTLPALAKKTKETFYAASVGTKSGTARAVKREFQDLRSVYVASAGDDEMKRSISNSFGVATPAVDVFVRSVFYGSTFTQVIRLNQIVAGASGYFGKVEFSQVPLSVKTVTLTADTTELKHVVYTRSKDEDIYPKLSSAMSDKCDYWIYVDTTDAPIASAVDQDGVAYQLFEVTFTADPYVSIVQRWFDNPENMPFGVSCNVRAMTPYDLSSFDVSFSRKRGSKFNGTNAVEEIYTYLRDISWPVEFTEAEVYDTMYYAGAAMTSGITMEGVVRYSPASKYVTTASNDVNDIMDNTEDIVTTSLYEVSQLYRNNEAYDSDLDIDFYSNSSTANSGFLLDKANIHTIEQ